MTKKELITKLEEFADDTEVFLEDFSGKRFNIALVWFENDFLSDESPTVIIELGEKLNG